MSRKLKDIKIKEISLVTSPANRKMFFFAKQDLKRDSEGNYICTNCENVLKQEIIDEDESCIQLECSECGLKINIIKEKRNEMKELTEIYKSFTEEDFSEEQTELAKELSEKSKGAITASLNMLNKYKADMPADLLDAIKTMTKYATGAYSSPTKKSDDAIKEAVEKAEGELKDAKEELEKAGKKLSKDTIEKIKAAVKALESLKTLLPEDEIGKSDSPDKDFSEDIKKMSETLDGKITKVVDLISKMAEESKKADEEAAERLAVLEKEKGTRKGIDGNDDDDDDDIKKGDKNTMWPSLAFEEVEE